MSATDVVSLVQGPQSQDFGAALRGLQQIAVAPQQAC